MLPTLITQLPSKHRARLVFACAWCPTHAYSSLHDDEYYTHGMCPKHKQAFITSAKARIKSLSIHLDPGTDITVPVR